MNAPVRPAPTLPDPRPRLVEADGAWLLAGLRCTDCGYRMGLARPRCPVCAGPTEPARFGPEGAVWASAVQRIALPGLDAPTVFAYLDLDDGPRCLVRCDASADPERPPAPGDRLRLTGTSASGDLLAGVAA